MHDRQNIELKVGQRVAYNLSGGIALGEIIDIKAKKSVARHMTYTGFNIFIKPDNAWRLIASKKGYSKLGVWTHYSDLVDKIVVLS